MAQGYDVEDLFCFVLLGFLCGGLGCVFIKLVERMIIARNAFVRGQAGKRYTFVVVMTAFISAAKLVPLGICDSACRSRSGPPSPWRRTS